MTRPHRGPAPRPGSPGTDEGVWGLLAGASGITALAGARLAPGIAAVLPLCPFRAATGLPCPTCGTTRALVALAQGHLGAAFAANPLAVAALSMSLVAGVWGLGRIVFPRSVPRPSPGAALQIGLARISAFAVLLNWTYLLATRLGG